MEINFNEIKKHNQLLEKFEVIEGDIEKEVEIKINFNDSKFLFPEYLLLLALKIIDLKEKDYNLNIIILNNELNNNLLNYASRIDFFKLINYNLEEEFSRKSSDRKFTEITKFNNGNVKEIADKIMLILIDKKLNEDMLTALNYCIYEILDNTLNHSKGDFEYGNGEGYVIAQYFPKKKKFRMVVADCGVGIHYSLTKHPKSKFKEFNEREAVLNSIVKGITNSSGKGFGLWASAEMIRLNGGELKIHSGNHCLLASSKNKIIEVPKWQGTYTFLEINTDKSVNLESIFENKAREEKELFEEYKQLLSNGIEELW